jgi:hypothetical protein
MSRSAKTTPSGQRSDFGAGAEAAGAPGEAGCCDGFIVTGKRTIGGAPEQAAGRHGGGREIRTSFDIRKKIAATFSGVTARR